VASLGIVSYRLGGADGVSVEAAKWADAFSQLGHSVRFIAGAGPSRVHVVEGLAMVSATPVDRKALNEALEDLDLVIVENLCSLPLNPEASSAVASALQGRPAIMHHHDLAWQRPDTVAFGAPPVDPAWRHVTINRRSQEELARYGIESRCLYNRFVMNPPEGHRASTRASLDVGVHERLVVQPTRALPRKNVPAGLHLAEQLSASYWLTAAAEDGYQAALDDVLLSAKTRTLRGPGPGTIDDVYAASDLVVLPSTWEGFGNPTLESVTHRKPLALGSYPVADEIRSFGFQFFHLDDIDALSAALDEPDANQLDRNFAIAQEHFDLSDLPGELHALLGDF